MLNFNGRKDQERTVQPEELCAVAARQSPGRQPAAAILTVIGGKTKNQHDPKVSRQPKQPAAPAELPAFSAQIGSPGPLPSLRDAGVMINEGLESYYTTLGAWRYLRQQYLEQAEDDCQRLVISALYSESFRSADHCLSSEQLAAGVAELIEPPAEISKQQLTAARERLLQLGLIRKLSTDRGEQRFQLNFPPSDQLRPPWPLSYDRRRMLLEKYGIENTYLALGQAAAIYQQAVSRADNQRQKILIERLSEEVLPEQFGLWGLSADELTCQTQLSPAEQELLAADLQYLLQSAGLRQTGAATLGAKRYALPRIRTDLMSAEYSEAEFAPAWKHAVAKHGPEYLWRFWGRIEYQREMLMAAAETEVERSLIRQLAELQSNHPRSGGFKRHYLVELVCDDLGFKDGDAVYEALDRSPVGQQLLTSWGAAGQQFLALVSDDYRWQSQAKFAENIPADQRAALLFALKTPERYHRALGRGIAIDEQLGNCLRGAVSDREVQQIKALFAPGLIKPGRRWINANELWNLIQADGGQSVEEKIVAVQRQLLDSGLLISRPDPHGPDGRAEQQYALAAHPLAGL